MSTLEERKRRGADLIKRYRSVSGSDAYACAADAIADILIFVAQTQEESTRLLESAEMEFRTATEGEKFLTEG